MQITIRGTTFYYCLNNGPEGWFMHSVYKQNKDSCITYLSNDAILVYCGYDTKHKQSLLYKSVLNYFIEEEEFSGYWPWCKKKEDIIKILEYLTGTTECKEFISLHYLLYDKTNKR